MHNKLSRISCSKSYIQFELSNLDLLLLLLLLLCYGFYWVLVVLHPTTMTCYYLDPLSNKPCSDINDGVNM